MRQKSWRSRSERLELLFGNAVVQCGWNGHPGVPDGCRWVVRVAVEVFDELSGVVSQPSCGFKDEWDQVDARVSVELFLFLAFGHVARASTGGGHEADAGGEGGYNSCFNILRDATDEGDQVYAGETETETET